MRIWSAIWALWLIGAVASFVILEAVALSFSVRDTLTDTSRTWLHVVTGQSPDHWTSTHQIVAVLMLVFMIWLFGHIIFGIWG